MNTEKRISSISKKWFYQVPLLFSVYCTHSLVNNENISVPLRTGKLRIEFSELLCSRLSDELLEDALKVEIYRILLQHPYTRKPSGCRPGILLLASDITLNQFYKSIFETAGQNFIATQKARFDTLQFPLGKKWEGTEELNFFKRNLQIDRKTGKPCTVDDLSFEQWYRRILFLVRETSIAGSENAGNASGGENFSLPSEDACELWEENQEAQAVIQNQIQKSQTEEGWGGLGGTMERALSDSYDFAFDYRRALTQFRQSIVSASRKLTRMKPSRRFGFKQMGSRYERKANVLIAVDVSGSITDESFERFYHAIRNFFFLGIIERIDLIFFDVNLKYTKAIKFTKNINLEQIKGRGGTNFQPACDYFTSHQNEYSGMIIFTDGEGSAPVYKSGKTNVLWILDNRLSYEKSHWWIQSLSGNKATYLP